MIIKRYTSNTNSKFVLSVCSEKFSACGENENRITFLSFLNFLTDLVYLKVYGSLQILLRSCFNKLICLYTGGERQMVGVFRQDKEPKYLELIENAIKWKGRYMYCPEPKNLKSRKHSQKGTCLKIIIKSTYK